MPTLSPTDLQARYQRNYRLTEPVTMRQIEQHLELERALTAELRASTPENRHETFVRAYATLYRELPWLNVQDDERMRPDVEDWARLIGPPPRTVHEVGSGSGALARSLADRGYTVEASEITQERGAHAGDRGVSWIETDGVHLDRYARAAPYDAVISDQVIEHLHPDDIHAHLRSAYAILKPGGRYVMETPLWYKGPADLSRVFGFREAVGMHLHEYTHRELAAAAREAGFTRVLGVFSLPSAVRRRVPLPATPTAAYLWWLRGVENCIDRLPPSRRKGAARRLKVPLFTRTLRLVAIR